MKLFVQVDTFFIEFVDVEGELVLVQDEFAVLVEEFVEGDEVMTDTLEDFAGDHDVDEKGGCVLDTVLNNKIHPDEVHHVLYCYLHVPDGRRSGLEGV